MKTCRKCGVEKSLEEFHKNKATSDGHLDKCKVCACRDRAEWRKQNPEKVKQEFAVYYERHRENILAYRAEWARNNKEKRAAITKRYRESHKEQEREYRKTYSNPASRSAIKARRRAREKGAPVVEKIDHAYIVARDKGVCHLCGKKPPAHLIELDHLVPLSRGGSHTAANLRVACRSCNRSRGAGRLPAQLLIFG